MDQHFLSPLFSPRSIVVFAGNAETPDERGLLARTLVRELTESGFAGEVTFLDAQMTGTLSALAHSRADLAVIALPHGQIAAPNSFVQKFIDTKRPGMHHICCEVASVEKAAEALRANGIEPFGGIIDSDWMKHTFIHPKDSGGVLFQLFEERG